jgi:hypothetical protein
VSPRARLLLIVVAVAITSLLAATCANRIGERKRASCERQGGASHWDRDGYRCVKDGESIEVSP